MANGTRVSFVTNAGALATRKRILAGKTQERFRSAAQTYGMGLKSAAIALSSGRVSSAEQRKLGHPYARRFPVNSGPAPDYIINQQTGLFVRSWRVRVQRTGRGWTVSLWNDAPYAAFLLGTRLMRVRPILEYAHRGTDAVMGQEVKKVVRASVQENGSYTVTIPTGGSAFGGVLYAVGVGVTSAAGAVERVF